MRSRPKTSANSLTPTSPNRCSGSPACRSIATMVKAPRLPFAGLAQTSTWSCSMAARCRPRGWGAAAKPLPRAVLTLPTSPRKASLRLKCTSRAAQPCRPAGSARSSISSPRARSTGLACRAASRARWCLTPRASPAPRPRLKYRASSAIPLPMTGSVSWSAVRTSAANRRRHSSTRAGAKATSALKTTGAHSRLTPMTGAATLPRSPTGPSRPIFTKCPRTPGMISPRLIASGSTASWCCRSSRRKTFRSRWITPSRRTPSTPRPTASACGSTTTTPPAAGPMARPLAPTSIPKRLVRAMARIWRSPARSQPIARSTSRSAGTCSGTAIMACGSNWTRTTRALKASRPRPMAATLRSAARSTASSPRRLISPMIYRSFR